MSFGCLWGAAPHRPTQATYLEVLTTPQPLLLEPLPTIHEHVVAGIPEARHEVVALSVGVHFKLRHGGLHLLVNEVAPFRCGTESLEVLKEGGAAIGGWQGRQPPLQPQGPVGTVQQRAHQWYQPGAALCSCGSHSWGLPVFQDTV